MAGARASRPKGFGLMPDAKEMLEQLIKTTKSEGRQARIWHAAVYRNEKTGEELIHPHFLEPDAALLRRRTISAPLGFTLARRTKIAVIELPAEKEAQA